jgi:hypothetical protein
LIWLTIQSAGCEKGDGPTLESKGGKLCTSSTAALPGSPGSLVVTDMSQSGRSHRTSVSFPFGGSPVLSGNHFPNMLKGRKHSAGCLFWQDSKCYKSEQGRFLTQAPENLSISSCGEVDTAAKIAQDLGVTVSDLAEANPGTNVSRLKIGQKIKVPRPEAK